MIYKAKAFPYCLVVSAFLLFPGFSPLVHALVIHNYTANVNDRFANSSQFLAADYNLSGIAIAPNNTWVTMISPNTYLASDHYKPGIGATITFYATNDPNGPKITRQVTSTRNRFGTSDLVIGTLDRPIPEGYVFYQYATETFTGRPPSWNNYPYNGPTLFHVGKSPGSYTVQLRTAVGQNKLSRRWTERTIDSPSASGPAIEADQDDPSSSNFVPYETMGVTGDSGGPLLFRYTDSNGQPALRVVGIAWYIYPGPPQGTGFTPVGHYATDIANFIDQHGMGFVPATPEDLVAQALDVSTIELTWDDLSSIETGYQVERSLSGEGSWTLIASLSANSTTYTDTALDAGTAYDYRVRAINANGLSDFSNTATAATPPPDPAENYQEWILETGLNELDEPESAPTADPDGDGIPNLMEYALGGNPLVPMSAELPEISIENTFMQLSFWRLRSDIDYQILASDDLINWTLLVENPGNVGEYVTVDDIVPIEEEDRRFMRLQVVLPE